VEEGIAEMLNIHMCLTSRFCEQARCWRNRVFCGHFKTFLNCGLPALAKTTSMSQDRIFNALLLGSSGGANIRDMSKANSKLFSD
jgi:hypothetical protein